MTSLFGGGSSINVNASGTLVPESFTPSDGQSVFNILTFTYTPGTNSILVFLNGTKQVVLKDYTETSNSSFTLLIPITALDTLEIIGFPLSTITQLNGTVAGNLAVSGNASVAGILTAGSLSVGSLSLAAINGGQLAGFRNRIINGAMQVAQYASTYYVANSGTNQAGFSVDRWFGQITSGLSGSGTSTYAHTLQPFTVGQTAVPGEPTSFLRTSVTAVGTLSGALQVVRVEQRIEGVRTFAGQTVTASFWAKADTSRTMAFVLGQVFGNGGSPSAPTGTGQTFNVTTTWQKFSITVAVPNISGKTIGTSGTDFLSSTFFLYKNDNSIFNDTLGAVGTWVSGQFLDLALVQLELGLVATPFEQRTMGAEMVLSQRYYQTVRSSVGIFGNSVTLWRMAAKLPVVMRINPSSLLNGTLTAQVGTAGLGTVTSIATNYSTADTFEVDFVMSSVTGTSGQAAVTLANSSGYVGLSAEF